MSKNWNDFCVYCTGNKVKDIRGCDDRNCPFYPYRRGGLEKEVEAEICQKILHDTGVLQ